MKKINFKKNKKTMILTALGILTILIFIGGTSYAYFKMQGNTNSQSDVNVTTATTDQLQFKISNAINLSVSALDFKKGSGNKSDSTTATAILTASNSVNIESTTERYNIYFVIENNDFVYTTSDAKPELLLKVTDPNGNTVENISGLINTENGFDITTRTGSFLLIPDYDITANRGKTTKQDWKVEVTLVNLDTDQTKNTGKTLSGKLYVTKDKMSSYELAQIKNVTTTSTYNSIETNLNIEKGSSEIDKYYFANELVSKNKSASDVKFVETDTPNYKFTNLEEDTTYKIYSYAIDKNGIKSNVYETEVNTDSYVLPSVTSVTHSITLNSITLNVNAKKGSNDVVKYYYSKDNGATYEESTSNSYTFNNLTDTTEYKIKVKVQDSDGRYSTEYYEAISTETYILPTVASVNATTKYNQISLTATGTKGTNEVAKYYYSINNGEYVEGTNKHTFTGLNEKTTYNIKVKVSDTQGRMSNIYETSVTTDAYVLPSITSVTTSSTSNSITINVDANNGDGTITKYYYSKDGGSNYIESDNNTYTFSDLTSNVTFDIRVYVKDSNNRVSSVSVASETTFAVAFDDFIKTVYTGKQGENNMYYHDSTLENGANDNSYRYAGSSETTKNFVCFGYDSKDGSCPTDNLYRIIGVFDNQVKLIKYDYASTTMLGKDGGYLNTYSGIGWKASTYGTSKGTNSKSDIGVYCWNKTSNSNSWSQSSLNIDNLNTNFTNYIGSNWTKKIASNTWKVGGNTSTSLTNVVAATAYTNEIVSPASTKKYSDKIGLMYVSDYGFAAAPSAWTTPLRKMKNGSDYGYGQSSITSVNWMYMGLYDFTITRQSDTNSDIMHIDFSGFVSSYDQYELNRNAIRPVFYLKTDVTFVGGEGTIASPYIIS